MRSPLRNNARLPTSVVQTALALMLLLLPPLAAARQATSLRQRRGLELSSVHQLIGDQRINGIDADVVPTFYNVSLVPRLEDSTFSGSVGIGLMVKSQRDTIELHAHPDLIIRMEDISLVHVER